MVSRGVEGGGGGVVVAVLTALGIESFSMFRWVIYGRIENLGFLRKYYILIFRQVNQK